MILEDILSSSPYFLKPDRMKVEEWNTILKDAIETLSGGNTSSALQTIEEFLAEVTPKLRTHFVSIPINNDPYTSYKYFVILHNIYVIWKKDSSSVADFYQVDFLELLLWLEQRHNQITSESLDCTIRFLTAWRDTLPC